MLSLLPFEQFCEEDRHADSLIMVRFRKKQNVGSCRIGLHSVILFISTFCAALCPLVGKASVPPTFNDQGNNRRLSGVQSDSHESLAYSVPAPAPTPSIACKGIRKLGTRSISSSFKQWECTSLVQSDCIHVTCVAPYTQTPNGSPCGCVLPIQVQLTLDISLDSVFEVLPTLVKDIASGILLPQNQARIIGLNAESDDASKSIVEIDLLPSGNIFDNATVTMILQKFENHQVFPSNSTFRNYTLLYVHYPGLALPTAGLYPHEKPLSVDVEKKSEKPNSGTLAVIIVSSIIALAAILGGVFLVFLKFNKLVKTLGTTKSSHMNDGRRLGSVLSLSSGYGSLFPGSISPTIASFCLSARKFSLHELDRATDSFSGKNVLGQGGFGQVFRGMLEDGSNIAVKVITRDSQQRAKEFMAEVEMLCRLHHRNLVKLIGVCTEGHQYCLVYELIPNGSVDSHLHDGADGALMLDWNTRLKIALGAARGLAYLHEDANPRVIHRDFKASNILLDEDFTPKIADFGLAKAAPDEENGYISTTVMGTFGYVAPEYAMTGHLLVKSDVYSFGVVLLELLSGRKPIDMTQPAGGESLVTWARPLLSTKEGLQRLMDPVLVGHTSFDSFSRVAAIASMCVQPDVSHRPFMGEVVQALKLVANCAEGIGSVTVSPQDSVEGSDDSGCPPSIGSPDALNTSNDGSFVSLDYDSGTCGTDKDLSEKHELFCNDSSKSNQSIEGECNIFRRHSFSGFVAASSDSTWMSKRYCNCSTVNKTRIPHPRELFSSSI
ncbi:hypothetical protein KP509_15G039500 [Ceratopteris richardii]|uniref:Protein kinase domain-containing protein n=1 Tax=Ceratopteris richardii TaxID=49495 RepID=A0A8T2T681_CERRI|nr:hypothetical protein KP509_15G039500 [Ceratopteris richardii]